MGKIPTNNPVYLRLSVCAYAARKIPTVWLAICQVHLLPGNKAQLSLALATLLKLGIFNMPIACADTSS